MRQIIGLGLLALASMAVQPLLEAQCACEKTTQSNGCQKGEFPCGNVYCQYCKYEPEYYNTYRCEWETVMKPVKKVRYVKRYTQQQKCRMVPEYYYVTQVTQEPEYYVDQEMHYQPKWYCDTHCKYTPRTYLKPVCQAVVPQGCDPSCSNGVVVGYSDGNSEDGT